MARRSKSSRRWLQEHFSDPHVRKAQASGYLSRAVFKLQELDERHRLFRPGMRVLDLGAAPGGWSQYAAERVAPGGSVVACDLLPVAEIPNVSVVIGDFREDSVAEQVRAALGGNGADLVMSDMAPNITGQRLVDQPRAMYLAELALAMALETLHEEGCFVTKLFQGEGSDAFVAALRDGFGRTVVRKPSASRDRSREVYALAWNPKL